MSLCRWTTTVLTPFTCRLELSTKRNRGTAVCNRETLNSCFGDGRALQLRSKSRTEFSWGVRSVGGESRKFVTPVGGDMKVFVVSDVHTDHGANMAWLKGLDGSLYRDHALICAGDVTDNLETFQVTMSLFKEKFREVFFVPGNHDLWIRRKEDQVEDSLGKLKALTDFCGSLGVRTTPANVGGVWIVPILSWYHESWDRERDIEGYHIPPVSKAGTDFSACKWPQPLDKLTDSIAQHFDGLNEENLNGIPNLQEAEGQVITFSHFLPRFELCPEKRMLFYPNLPKMVGSDWLEARVRSIHGVNGSPTACHIFGHTHFAWDAILDGVRYIQAPLAYPREREQRQVVDEKSLPLCIYDSENGGLIGGPLQSKWSAYYRTHKRDPDNQEFAPWVMGHYQPIGDSPLQPLANASCK